MNLLLFGNSNALKIIEAIAYAPNNEISNNEEFELHKGRFIDTKERMYTWLQVTNDGGVFKIASNHGEGFKMNLDRFGDLESFNNKQSHCFFWLSCFNWLIEDEHSNFDYKDTIRYYIEEIVSVFGKSNIHIVYPAPVYRVTANPKLNANYNKLCGVLEELCKEYNIPTPELYLNKDIYNDPDNYSDGSHLLSNFYRDIWTNIKSKAAQN